VPTRAMTTCSRGVRVGRCPNGSTRLDRSRRCRRRSHRGGPGPMPRPATVRVPRRRPRYAAFALGRRGRSLCAAALRSMTKPRGRTGAGAAQPGPGRRCLRGGSLSAITCRVGRGSTSNRGQSNTGPAARAARMPGRSVWFAVRGLGNCPKRKRPCGGRHRPHRSSCEDTADE
jgi:hypothetical protein